MKLITCFSAAVAMFISLNSMAKNHGIPVIRVDTNQATPLQIGLDIGRQTKALFPNIEQQYDKHLATVLSPSRFQSILKQQLPLLLAELNPDFRDEIRGLEGAWSFARGSEPGDGLLSIDEFYLLNLLPDLGLAPNGVSFAAFSHAANDKSPIVGHNLDWQKSQALRGLQTITVYEHSDRSVVNIGFAGITSVLSGFNSQGLFVSSSNAAKHSPYASPKQFEDSKSLHSIGFDLRQLLSHRNSNSKAKRYLMGRNYSYALNILIADEQGVEVLESSPDKAMQERNWKSETHSGRDWGKKNQVGAVNCFVLKTMPNNCQDPKNIARWQRLKDLAVFGPDNKASAEAIANIMFDQSNDRYEIFNESTLQSLVYRSASKSLYLYADKGDGQTSDVPAHEVFLDLLPASQMVAKTSNIHLKSYVWILLVCMVGALLWVFRKQDHSS